MCEDKEDLTCCCEQNATERDGYALPFQDFPRPGELIHRGNLAPRNSFEYSE